MKKLLLALVLVLALTFSACGGNGISPEKVGATLAEITCSTLTMDITSSSTPSMDEIAQSYGFESYLSIMEYLKANMGTTQFNEINVALRTKLDEMCGKELEDFGLNSAEMAESIMTIE